jgi:transcriptional regulator with XRE-family HTH domain
MPFGKHKERDQTEDTLFPDGIREILVALGGRITEARTEAGLTMAELAASVNVPKDVLKRFESGDQDPSRVLGAIAQVTGKPVPWFLAGQEDGKPPAETPGPTLKTTPVPTPRLDAIAEARKQRAAQREEQQQAGPPSRAAVSETEETDAEPEEDDALDELMASLSRQRERLRERRAALEERERSLETREAALETKEREVMQLHSALREWESKLEMFEKANRASAETASSLADWANLTRQSTTPELGPGPTGK